MHHIKCGFLLFVFLSGLYFFSCAGSQEDIARIHTSLDLIDYFPRAVHKNGEVRVDSMNMKRGGIRSVIYTSPGASVTFPVFLHTNPRLHFEWGIRRRKPESPWTDGDEVILRIMVGGEKEGQTVFKRVLSLKTEGICDQWIQEDVSLKAFEGERVKLTLYLQGDRALDLSCGWANPEILSDGKRPEDSKENPGKNVVLVSVDTLRADHLHCYGYSRETSPALDRLAAGGVLFEHAYSQAHWTLPSHMSLFTSLYPDTHRVPSESAQKLNKGIPTLASVLNGEGYRTAGFAREAGNMNPKYGFGYGFDRYSLRFQDIFGFNRRVARWLEDMREERFFLFLHLFDPHSDMEALPYEGPEEYVAAFAAGMETEFQGCKNGVCASRFLESVNNGENQVTQEEVEYMKNLYDAGVLQADNHLGLLMETLQRLNLLDKTMIVFTADHGEEFMEHGKLLHCQFYNETIHVPMIFYFPGGGIPRGKRAQDLVENIDVMPTILELLGITYHGYLQGRSLAPCFRGEGLTEKILYGTSVNVPNRMVRSGPWKLVFLADGRKELFNLDEDPEEKHDLAEAEEDIYIRLMEMATTKNRENSALFNKIQAEYAEDTGDSVRVNLSEAEKENLRALGYLEGMER